MLLSRNALLFLLVLAGAANLSVAQAAARAFYVDCSAAANGGGESSDSPWNSLDAVNAQSFEPGDTIRLRRGTVCHGVLTPRGSGAEGKPIRLTAYGDGERPKVIAPPSAGEALRLFNQEYWEIDSLDLAGGHTNGIFISGDHGVLHHLHLRNLTVHDVMGGAMKHKESGLVAISPGSVNVHFDDVLVDGVTAWNTNQWVGILVGGGDLGFPPESTWNTNVVIRNSAIHDVEGDGIVLFRVHGGRIETSVAWNTGMQPTQTIGTPNAIWTWMCDDCTVADNEAYLSDSPGVDGGAYDIDYGNTRNSVIDNYGHDTQGYCIAVFGAGFVTRESTVRGNLCIDNGRSPRMASYQGAIFLYSWNDGSIDGLTIEDNTVEWSPFEAAPALLNNAAIRAGTAVFRNNTINSTSPWMADSNTSLTLSQNRYRYFGSANPEWRYGTERFSRLADLQSKTHQEGGSTFTQEPLERWSERRATGVGAWRLSCELPAALDGDGLMSDAVLRQIVVLKSFARQYRASGLLVSVRMTAPDARIFASDEFRRAKTDLDLEGMMASEEAGNGAERTVLTAPDGKVAGAWDGFVGPVQLGSALRQALGEPIYAQMGVESH